MSYDFLDDFHGNKSSKRFWGGRFITLGIFGTVLIYFAGIIGAVIVWYFDLNVTSSIAMMDLILNFGYTCSMSLMSLGAGLLFSTLLEPFGVFKKKHDK